MSINESNIEDVVAFARGLASVDKTDQMQLTGVSKMESNESK